MNESEYEGILIGNLNEMFGMDSIIEISETELHKRNINLTVNRGENYILCSAKLSNWIRENRLNQYTNELKKFAIYEFPNNRRYVIFSTDSNWFYERQERFKEVKMDFMNFSIEHLKLIQNINLTEIERIKANKDFKQKQLELKNAIEKINKEYELLL